MSAVYLYFEATGKLHVSTSKPIFINLLHIYKTLCKEHGEGGVMYWHDSKEWLQWHPDTMRMHLSDDEVPTEIRALHLVHT